MTVTMTFCDRCGSVIAEGETVARMVLNAHEYDLCSECHQVLTGDLQSKGRPVPEPSQPKYPIGITGATGPVGPLGSPGITGAIGTQGDQGSSGPVGTPWIVPYVQPNYPNTISGWELTVGGAGIVPNSSGAYVVSGNAVGLTATLSAAISNASLTIGNAIAAANAEAFPPKN